MDIVQKLSESCFCEGRGCDLCEAAREILKLRESLVDSGSALLACEMRLNAALARDREPNCLTCAQFNQGACLLRLYHGVMCVEGDHYAEVKPMRLYEREKAVTSGSSEEGAADASRPLRKEYARQRVWLSVVLAVLAGSCAVDGDIFFTVVWLTVAVLHAVDVWGGR